jgi:hypothetical protein
MDLRSLATFFITGVLHAKGCAIAYLIQPCIFRKNEVPLIGCNHKQALASGNSVDLIVFFDGLYAGRQPALSALPD